jgi:hypothetical protein
MKISKLLSAACVFAVCAGFATVRAQDNPAQAAARAALMKQMNQQPAPPTQPPPAAPAAPQTPVAPAAPAAAAAPVIVMQTNAAAVPPAPKPATVSIPGRVPIVAPALPISLSKEERLQALLDLYKADQITPEQYQKQRAAILAEP